MKNEARCLLGLGLQNVVVRGDMVCGGEMERFSSGAGGQTIVLALDILNLRDLLDFGQ